MTSAAPATPLPPWSNRVVEMAGADQIHDRLIVRRADPLNAEVRISRLVGLVTPTENFYVRSHFPVPRVDISTWRLEVHGLVKHPLSLGMGDLLNMPAKTTAITLECAGNGRAMLRPQVDGEQWELGAVSTGEWTGVSLGDVLDRAGIESSAKSLIFRAADAARDAQTGNPDRFERSLTLDEVQQSQALLAYAMNGAPLTADHGFPLRVIVPGWYAVASVKWLIETEVTDQPFSHYFQTEKYVYLWDDPSGVRREPVRLMRVRSLTTQPTAGQTVKAGELAIRGYAWSGAGDIAHVDVSLNAGAWTKARLVGQSSRYRWQPWEMIAQVDRQGELSIRSRAGDEKGNVQPEQPEWNRLGYGNNATQELVVRVV